MNVPNPFSLQDTTALITGASSGLGAHFSRTLALNGARVVLSGRRKEQLENVVGSLNADGFSAAAIQIDVTDSRSVEAGFNMAESAFGPVNLLINNAGITKSTPAIELDEDAWDKVIDTNVKGAWLCAKAFARRRIANGHPGNIINIASILGLRVAGHVSAYAASKAAMIQLTHSLALELARYHIRVNALAPGYVATDLNRAFFQTPAGEALIRRIPQRSLCEPSDLDGPLLLLASNASRAMTGAVIPVDGGHLVTSL